MKHTITLFLWLLLLATSFESHNSRGWYSLKFPATGHVIEDICFIDSLRGWAITDLVNDTAYILYTSNGGEDWQVQSDDPYYLYSVDFVNDNTGYIAASQPPGRILKTTNGGTAWFIVSQLEASPIDDIDFTSHDTGWICSTDSFDGGIFRTTNGGASWQRQVNPLLGYQHLDFLNRDTGWCLLEDGKVFKTTNSGINWLQFPTVVLGTKTGIQFTSDLTGWVITRQFGPPEIFRTTTGGLNWSPVRDPDYLDGSPYDLDLLSYSNGRIAKLFGVLALVNDSVLGKQTIPLTPLPRLRAIDMVDSITGFSAGGVFLKTTDGGGPITSVREEEIQLTESFSLEQNYPNPFNAQTLIRYSAKAGGNATVRVFDITGKFIAELYSGRINEGRHEIMFDASALASGVYVCVFIYSSYNMEDTAFNMKSIRMLLTK